MATSLLNLQSIHKGDKTIPSKTWNQFRDFIESQSAVSGTGGTAPVRFLIHNKTEIDLNYGNAVSLEEPLFDIPGVSSGGDNQADRYRHFIDRTYKAVKPKEDYPLAITLEPIGKEKIGRVAVSGIVRAIVDVKNKDHARVTFTSGTVELESSNDGDLSFYIPSQETGKQWCDLQFGSPGGGGSSCIAVMLQTLSYANSLMGVNAYIMNPDRTTQTEVIRVYCRGMSNGTKTIDTGKRVVCNMIDGRWEVVGEYC